MYFLIFFLFPFLEIYLFYKAISHFGFLDTILWVVTAFMLGMALTFIMGRSILFGIQKDLSQGRMPLRQALHKGMIVFAGFLFMIPGIGTDIIAVLLVLPVTRHLAVFYLETKLKLAIAKGSAKIFTTGFGGMGAGGFSAQFRRGPIYRETGFAEEAPLERDAQIIDITPLSIEDVPRAGRKSEDQN